MNEELKQCPFCGSDDIRQKTVMFSIDKNQYTNDVIKCAYCGAEYRSPAGSMQYARKKWNTRPIEDELRKQIDEANKRIAELEKELELLK